MNLSFAKWLDRMGGSLLGRALAAADLAREAFVTPPPVETVRHILITKFWGLGNWALLRPVVRDLGARWPAARLTAATLAENLPLVHDLVDDVFLVRTSGATTLAADLARVVTSLRGRPPDLALDFELFAHAGALIARLAGARQRVGFRTGSSARDGLYTVTVPVRGDAHVSRSFRDLAEAAGVAPGPYRAGALRPDKAGLTEIAGLGLRRDYVVLHPGSGDNFPGRRWSAEGFGAVGRQALQLGHGVFVTGSAREKQLAERVAVACGPGAVCVAGRLSLQGLVALLAAARALVSNDTGPVHLASALGIPTLAMYGPNTPVLYGPLAPRSRAFYRSLPCSPCLTSANYRSSRCRIHTCMQAISTGAVAHALGAVLEASTLGEPAR